jgi:hypothetical protein
MLSKAILAALAVALIAPAGAEAGTAISTVPNLPSGAMAGGTVTVSQTGLPGHVVITQTFNGADAGATARLRLIRLSVNCGPGPSPGNPNANGPAINTPEAPCTNPDPGVFAGLSSIGTGEQSCSGVSFAITAPDSQGQVDMLPSRNVDLGNGFVCEITFNFSVMKTPTLDTFPSASGMQTTSVSSVRSEIVTDPGNPGAVGLQAAGLGSGDAVLVQPDCSSLNPPSDCLINDCASANPPSTCVNTDCASVNPPSSCGSGGSGGANGANASSPKLRAAGTCARSRVRASVTGSGIKKVTFLIDGHVVGVDKKAPFKLNVSAHRLSAGSHRLTASVTFTGTGPSQVLKKRFSRCRDPNFTG